MEFWNEFRSFLEAVISIFAIVNPIGNLPIFTSLSQGYTTRERRHIFRVAGVTSLVIICLMAVMGQYVMTYVFHVSLNEFMFGGGIILMVVGIKNILTSTEREYAAAAGQDDSAREESQISLAVSPIASPLLVGPGSIVTVMLIVQTHGVLYGLAACISAFVFVILILNYAHVLDRVMGRIGTLAVGRIMQIFIVAIGAHFVFRCLRDFLEAQGK